jgi:hypothetical protein
MLNAKARMAKTQEVVSVLGSIKWPAKNAIKAHPSENKIVNRNLKIPFAKNKKANRKFEAIPTDKAIAGCTSKYLSASMPAAKAAKKNSV